MAMKKLWKLKKRRFLRFTSISVFATILLAKMHPTLSQITEKTVVGNNSINIALTPNILEIAAGLLLVISLVLAMLGIYLMADDSNQWKALGISLLGLLVGFFLV